MRLGTLALSLALAVTPLAAQSHDAAAPTADAAHSAPAKVDIITPHITDSKHLELPYWKPPFAIEVELPTWSWAQFHVGPMLVDLSPTKHVVMMLLAAVILLVLLTGTARAHRRAATAGGVVHGKHNALEAIILYMRDEVILPNVGHHGEGFVPLVLTIFFFILTMNLLGLVPYGATATGNIAVTATLAIIAFFTIEIAGVRAQGVHYLNTLFYWNKDLPLIMRVLMFVIMSPVEMIGKLTKPFALAIRLFANMTAGHIVVLAFIGLIFLFQSLISGAPFAMAVAIMVLELFVAFLQAFIFSLLTSVFIGQIREAHH
ncbi:MAG: F0F1 ATP synthase subunit A [Gemmatimonadaceae bacterium]|nr:F0F1 ATP synthase subunit A [Gemmatimonadaceae bacterium]